MSKHHVHVQCRAMHDIQTMTHAELEEKYGIEIDTDDGTVWDPCEMKQFDTLADWAAYMQEQEEADYDSSASFQKIGGRHRYDDDY